MGNVMKLIWGIRALVYKIILKKILFPSYIGKPIFLLNTKNISIERRVRIFPGVRMECHLNGKIFIEENVSIGQNLHIISGGNLRIGKNTTISGNVLITNIDHEYKNIGIHILKQELIIKDTEIGENSFIGYGATIQAGTILGKQCIVGSNSFVKGNFPDFCVIAGNPAKVIKKYNEITKKWEKV
ncbi:acyltransferase [Fusobacterium sp. SB021]|uniref:acyltransferase n=1 Tax=Fusobacterium sp. SB021 TaxID=2744227 RepID=UPI003CF80A31